MTKLLFIFIGIPLLELMILIELGREIGFWPTIFLVIVTGVLGASLARSPGVCGSGLEIQHELSQGNMPADKLSGRIAHSHRRNRIADTGTFN